MNTYSRFSVLSSEVDLDAAFKVKKPKSEKKKESKPVNGQKQNDNIPVNGRKATLQNAKSTISINKKKNNQEKAELQALAFGIGRSKGAKKNPSSVNNKAENQISNHKSKKEKGNIVNGVIQPDDDWKKRDDEFVKKQNEKCLREAILQSKLEQEQVNNAEDEKEVDKKEKGSKVNKTKKRKEKPITISLDQFNSLKPNELASLRDSPLETKSHALSPKNGPKLSDENFLKDIDEATRKVLEKEHRHEQYKANFNKGNKDIQLKKLVSEIEKRDFEIQALRLEVESLKKLMQEVKSRNKKLCEVISCSEMRSKGELVVELEKVSRGREEFSEEVTLLNGQLEQERTKVSQLTNELKKMQGKKRNSDSTSK